MKKLLVTGASGFLGWNICNVAKLEWQVYGAAFVHPVKNQGVKIIQINLTNFHEIKNLFKNIHVDAVIHAAAMTSPNYCQDHAEEAKKINIDAAVNIAGLCSDNNIPFVFTSTDLVFDGTSAPYKEDDPVSPINTYGEQKAIAEEKILGEYPDSAVCRMPLMFGEPSPAYGTFFHIMLKALREGEKIRLFTDEYRTPLSAKTAAEGLLIALSKGKGILHVGGRERISRYDFGKMMTDIMGYGDNLLIACEQKDMIMAAPRAKDLSLDSSKAFAMGFNPNTLKQELEGLLTTLPFHKQQNHDLDHD